MDLLLHLITKNRIDIADIPISIVTNQYLEYLEILKALDIEVAAEYLLMAATLIQIKSKILLPRHKPCDHQEEDPRLQITEALKELQRAKELAERMDALPMLGRDVFLNGYVHEEAHERDEEPGESLRLSVFELIEAFSRLLKAGGLPQAIEIQRASVRLSEKVEELEKRIGKHRKLSFFSLLGQTVEKTLLIVTFLAVLELSKKGVVRLFQGLQDGDIMIVRRRAFTMKRQER